MKTGIRQNRRAGSARTRRNLFDLEPLEKRMLLTVQPFAPIADAYVRGGTYDGTNFGTNSELHAKTVSAADGNRNTYLRFDISSLGASQVAKLRLYGRLSDLTPENVTVTAYQAANATWQESGTSGITWAAPNPQPGWTGSAIASEVVPNSTPAWYEFDVSSLLAGGATAISVQLRASSGATSVVKFDSKEGTNKPELVVTKYPQQPTNLTGATASLTQATIKWSDNSSFETNYRVERSGNGGTTWSTISLEPANTTQYVDRSVAAGTTYQYRVVTVDAHHSSAPSSAVSVAIPDTAVGTWASTDIGSVGVAGSYSGPIGANGTMTVKGSGNDIHGLADSFQFVHQQVEGDGSFVTKLTSQQAVDNYAKSGLMARESLAPNSRYTMLFLSNNGMEASVRSTNGGSAVESSTINVDAPIWMKLTRSGNVFSHHRSTDGSTWTLVQSDTITLPSKVYVGLAVTSHNNAVLSTTTFENLSFSGGWATTPTTGATIYVDKDAPGVGGVHNGQSWATAYKTIKAGLMSAGPGATVLVAGGTYRATDTAEFLASNVTLRAADPNDKVILKGSDQVDSWVLVDSSKNLYKRLNWQKAGFAASDDYTSGALFAQFRPRNQLFVQESQYGEELLNNSPSTDAGVLALTGGTTTTPWNGTLEPGEFYFNDAANVIYMRTSGGALGSRPVEVTVSDLPFLKSSGFSGLHVQDLEFRHLANPWETDFAAVQFINGHDVEIRNITVDNVNGAGLSIRRLATSTVATDGTRYVVRNSKFNRNGQIGMLVSRVESSTFADNETSFNNTRAEKLFDPYWEAGGNKFSRTRNVVVDRHLSRGNVGGGIWFDVDNQNATIRNSKLHENYHGIHYEISYTGRIYNNVVYGNIDPTPGTNDYMILDVKKPENFPGTGIYVSSSAHCDVYNNTVWDNDERGIFVRDDVRDDGVFISGNSGPKYSITAYGNEVFNNVIAENRKGDSNGIHYQVDRVLPAAESEPDWDYDSRPQYDHWNSLHKKRPESEYAYESNQSNYNVFWAISGNTSRFFSAGTSASVTDSLTTWRSTTGEDANSHYINPNFEVAVAGNSAPNLRRVPNGVELNKGKAIPLVSLDFDGVPRPQGGGYDMGAFEYRADALKSGSIVAQTTAPAIVQTSGLQLDEVFDTKATGGTYTTLFANAVGQSVTFRVDGVAASKQYNVYARVHKGSQRGTFRLDVADSIGGTYANIGSQKDHYDVAGYLDDVLVGTYTSSSSGGSKYFRFAIDGKNVNSGGYALSLDHIRLQEV